MTFIVFAQLFHAGQAVIEEHILKSYGGQEPFHMLGCEGVFGAIITSTILLLAQFAECPSFLEGQCENGLFDDAGLALK